MLKYKIGDKVRVRQWDDMVKEFGVDKFGDISTKTGYFTRQMKEFCGCVYEIDAVLKKGYWLKDRGGYLWYFTDDMLEDVVSPSLEASSLFFGDDRFDFEFKDDKISIKLKTPKTLKTQKESKKKMKKQMTQRERLEGQLKEYRRDSGINSIEIIVPGKIVKVTINDCLGIGTTFTMKCHNDDTFSLEKAIILAYVKYESEDLTPKGIEYEAEIFTHFKDNMKKLKKAMKVYEIQQKLKELDDEEAIVRERKRQKKIAQKQRRAERLAEEKLKETKEAAKIYADALKSAFSDCEISEDTVKNIVKDMNVRM